MPIPESAAHDLQQLFEIVNRLSGVIDTPEQPETNPIYYRSAREAAESDPAVYGKPDSVRWHLRNRKTNGLLESGAVVERRSRPDQKRPSLIIDHFRWVDWMLNTGRNAA